MRLGQALNDLGSIVFGTVIDNDKLVDRGGLRKDAPDGFLDKFGAVVERNDRRDRDIDQADILFTVGPSPLASKHRGISPYDEISDRVNRKPN